MSSCECGFCSACRATMPTEPQDDGPESYESVYLHADPMDSRMPQQKHSKIQEAIENYGLVLGQHRDVLPIIQAARKIAAELTMTGFPYTTTPLEVLAVWVEMQARP